MFIKKVVVRGISDTMEFFGWSRKTLVWPILMAAGYALHYYRTGSLSGPMDELMLWLTYTFAPVGVFAILLLLFNVACAPYRIERDAHNKAKELLVDLPDNRHAFAGILTRRNEFTLAESANLMVDGKLIGDLSHEANAQFRELKEMMRDEKIERLDVRTAFERLDTLAIGQYVDGNPQRPLPWSSAKISKESLIELSRELNLPIRDLQPNVGNADSIKAIEKESRAKLPPS